MATNESVTSMSKLDQHEQDWQPQVSGALVRLRPLQQEDFDALHAAASDPLIWALHPEPDRYKREVFQRYFDTGLRSGMALLVRDAQTGEVIGCSRFDDYSPATSSVEIGYTFLVRRCWGGAYNRELKQLMLDHALARVQTVYFVVGQGNLRSQGAMRKLGARQLPQAGNGALPLSGDLSKSVVFVIARPEVTPPGR